jgi:hypothetical protein
LTRFFAVPVLLVLAFAGPAFPQTNTWRGVHPPNVVDVWSNAGEWSLGVVPDGSTDILIGFDTVAGDTSFTNSHTLTLGPPATLMILSGTTITNASTGVVGGTGTLLNYGTIQGSGTIGVSTFTNQAGATINANTPGQVLTVAGSGMGMTNAGLMTASNSGTLNLTGSIGNAGGTISGSQSGSVALINAFVSGGTLNGVQVGTTAGGNGAFLDGSSAGAITLQGSNVVFSGAGLLGTFNNQGFLFVSSVSSGAFLELLGDTTLQGGGAVVLGIGTGMSSLNLLGRTLTNTDNLIGNLSSATITGGFLTNGPAGRIVATAGPGYTLLLDSTLTVTNLGLLAAEGGVLDVKANVTNSGGTMSGNGFNGGYLLIEGMVNNQGGTISAVNGGAVELRGATIQGGTLNAAAGTFINAGSAGATLDGSTLAGALTILGQYQENLGQTTIRGPINNEGSILVNAIPGQNASLTLSGNALLDAGGAVTLQNFGGGTAFINANAAGFTLTNVDNTIQGAGVIGANVPVGQSNPLPFTLVNGAAGIINANAAGQQLLVDPGSGITNAGLMEATGGGQLLVRDDIQNAGGSIIANGAGSLVSTDFPTILRGGTVTALNGGTVQLHQTDVVGATLNNAGGAIHLATSIFSGNFLDGLTSGAVTIQGTLTADPGTFTGLSGTINNTGNILVNSQGGLNTRLAMDTGTLTLQGGGTVTLANLGGGGISSLDEFGAGAHTFINVDNTIQGAGAIQGTGSTLGLQLINEAGGTILANAAGQTLTINTNGFTNAGAVLINAGSTLQVLAPFTQTGGRTQVDGTMVVAPGENVSGGMVLGTGGTINGNVTMTGGIMQPGGLMTPGLLRINGNYSQSGATFNELISGSANGVLFVNGAATFGPGSGLNVILFSGFKPFFGEKFVLADFLSGAGTFGNAPSSGFQMDGFNWTIFYLSNAIVLDAGSPVGLTPTPEPESLALLATGLAGVAGSLLRKRAAAKRS